MHVDSCSSLRFERAVCLEALMIFFFFCRRCWWQRRQLNKAAVEKVLGGRTFRRLLGGNMPTIRRPRLDVKGQVQLERHCASQGRSSENPHFFILEGVSPLGKTLHLEQLLRTSDEQGSQDLLEVYAVSQNKMITSCCHGVMSSYFTCVAILRLLWGRGG